ncbi:MAG: GNAT family N-acetyltransferase [Myxococcales bacterium]|nr:GNAT family N-acetyltransferase [Myxococcales bacterium]MDH5305747.1 GNAT family N-acetyltransferase [Myxococcales bacterium]MDH5565892.1 GNAT family N-acetyltransferase [Myxococcales bacterium]
MTSPLSAHFLAAHERQRVLEYLAPDARENLLLIDLVARHGCDPAPGEAHSEIAVATRDGAVVGVVSLRPSIVFDARFGAETLDAVMPLIEPLGVGLVKSDARLVGAMWSRLSRHGRRRAVVDRNETAYTLSPEVARFVDAAQGWRIRPARSADLDLLVYAARESLREEDRPDPFAGDARSFRRWVRGRVARARVVECEGRVAFVGYADVQRREGWLLQGIYTWPAMRRRGLGAAGTSDLCREAFAHGADHVQLAVVEGNDVARALYEGIGFKPFARLRTILFA